METHLVDPQVQSMGVHILRAVISQNATAKHLILLDGGAKALVKGVQSHPNNESLLAVALEAMDEIHGLPTLLQALENLKASVPGVRAALGAILQSVRARWTEIEEMASVQFLAPMFHAVTAHKADERIVISGLNLVNELTRDSTSMRGAFSATGGWDWTLGLLELHVDHPEIQMFGCKLLSSLGRGGSWDELHALRVSAVLERTLCVHGEDNNVMYWALWAVQQLNGARSLTVPLSTGVFKTANATVNAIKCLGGISLGQSESSSLQDMPAIIDAVVYTMDRFMERFDVLYESTLVLAHSAGFVLGQLPSETSERNKFLESVLVATRALIRLIHVRSADAYTTTAACQSLAEILETCQDDSPVRHFICKSLLSDVDSQGEHLLSRLAAMHVSNDQLQTVLMWVFGVARGAAPVVAHMSDNSTSHSIQMPAIKTLGKVYERIELEVEDAKALPGALRAVVDAMARFPENLILQQHACYALCTMAEHCGDEQCNIGDETLVQCLAASARALRLVQGRDDSGCHPSKYNALDLRKEATRCFATALNTRPVLGRWLRENGVQELLVGALQSTADGVWDGTRDSEAEKTLCWELLALSYVLGPSDAILVPLRRWGSSKPAVVRAVADAVVELIRGCVSRVDCADPAFVGDAPSQALRAAGCGDALLATMAAHKEDEDLQTRIQLAAGFVGATADCSG
eukprot:TRINITY_DN9722_c0_g1_i1.p1 TRINITY_DN9722_c0_g1~~TRINITY_DN9722_c0_g1_i1.p1  ORF type:complete len:786 (+),score=143.92 TRINITY_DN9722_c0_g1_i1:281-2359(+)